MDQLYRKSIVNGDFFDLRIGEKISIEKRLGVLAFGLLAHSTSKKFGENLSTHDNSL